MATKKAAPKAAKEKPAAKAVPVEVEVEQEPVYDKGPLLSFNDIADERSAADDMDLFESLLTSYREENEKEVAAKNAKEALKPEIKGLADKLDIKHAGNEAITYMLIKGKQPDEIVAEALLEMGVSLETIQAATKKGKSYFYFQVVDSDAVKAAKKAAKDRAKAAGIED